MYRALRLQPRILVSPRPVPWALTKQPPGSQICRSPFKPRLFNSALVLRSTDLPGSSTEAQDPKAKASPSRLRRFAGASLIAIIAFAAGLLFQTQRTISRIMAAPAPVNEEAIVVPNGTDEHVLEVENFIYSHPIATSLRENPNFTETRQHLAVPAGLRPRTLTSGTLAGPGRIVVPPLMFHETGGKSLVSIFYLGSDVCGHPGIVHGGLLATLLDEGLARCCFPALPNKAAVTANLNIDYRRPAMAESYFVLRAETVKVEGRKAWVEGRIETLPEEGKEPVVLVEAKALFIEPKQAATLSKLYKPELM